MGKFRLLGPTLALTGIETEVDLEGIVKLSYSAPNAELATSCEVTDPAGIAISTACSCDILGSCTVGVRGTNNGSASFNYSVTTPSGVSNISSASLMNHRSFVTKWNTTNVEGTHFGNSSGNNEIQLSLASGGAYNFIVNWGDGTQSTITPANSHELLHAYTNPGIYTVKIRGNFPGLALNNLVTNDRLKLIEIQAWGAIAWTTFDIS